MACMYGEQQSNSGSKGWCRPDVKGIFLLSGYAYDEIYSLEDQQRIGELVDLYAPPHAAEQLAGNMELLNQAEVVFSGWGMPKMDEAFLDQAPNLKIVFYGAGAIYRFATDAMWERGIRVTTAAELNAVPVAEYVLSQILFSLKLGWQLALGMRDNREWPSRATGMKRIPGAYLTTVGIVSLGAVSTKLIELLRSFDVNVLVCGDHITPEKAARLRVECTTLEEVFQRSDVVSIHSPPTPENIGMITGGLIAQMKPNATLINSARGAVVCQREMMDVLRERPDLIAVLDVTDPEPPPADSELFTVPNIVITPHIAGSIGKECQRMGHAIVGELKRYLAGAPLRYEIIRKKETMGIYSIDKLTGTTELLS